MTKLRWGNVGIFSAILWVGACAPTKYFALKLFFDYAVGHRVAVGVNSATHLLGASLIVFGLLVLLLTFAQFSKLKELIVAILFVSIALFPMTFRFLFCGLFLAISATFLIYGLSRIRLGYHYYFGRASEPEQDSDGTPAEANQSPHQLTTTTRLP